MIELKTDLQLYMEKHQEQIQTNPKKRKQMSQNSEAPTMTLRSRFKKRKLNNEDEEQVSQIDEDATYCNAGENAQGASYIRYEIIEKKGKQMVVPVRYSIRRTKGGNRQALPQDSDLHLERQILNNQIEVEYKPNQMEGMFQLDQSAQDIRRLLIDQATKKEANERMKVQIGDI